MTRDSGRAGPPGPDRTPPGPPALDQDFGGRSLHALRSAVAAHAAEAGLSRQRVYDVTVAAHELAANTVRHGPGHGRLRLWIAENFLYCQVSDDGITPSPGQLAADPGSWPVQPGHGLWLVHQVADEFTIVAGPAGVRATVTFALASAPRARPVPAPRSAE